MLCSFKMANKYGVGFKKHKLVKSIRKKNKNVISQKKRYKPKLKNWLALGEETWR